LRQPSAGAGIEHFCFQKLRQREDEIGLRRVAGAAPPPAAQVAALLRLVGEKNTEAEIYGGEVGEKLLFVILAGGGFRAVASR